MTATTAFYSCKDTDEDALNDLRAEMIGQNTTLKELLDTQKSELQSQIDALKTQLSKINSCTCATEIAKIKSDIEKLQSDKADQTTVDGLISRIEALEAKEDCSCKAQWDALLAALQAKNFNGDDVVSAFTQLINKVADLETAKNTINSNISEIQKVLGLIDEAGNSTGTNAITEINSRIDKIEKYTEVIKNLIGDDKDLEKMITNLQTLIQLGDKFGDLVSTINSINVKATADSTWIATVKGLYGDNLESLVKREELKDSCANIRSAAAALANNALTEAKSYVDSQIEDLKNTTIKDLSDKYDALEGSVSGLETKVSSLEGRMTTVETDLNTANNRITALENYKNSLITSVIVQATKSPLTLDAALSLPVGVQSNMLFAYYGTALTSASKFPSTSAVNNAGEQSLTADDLEGSPSFSLYQGMDLQSGAGKIYMTVNPNTADLSGAKFQLVDSRNNPAGIQLSEIKKSDELLKFGFTRASSNNGFYEADATITDLDNAAVDLTGLKSAASDIKTFLKTRTGIKDMVYGVLTGVEQTISLPAYALQASYTANGETSLVHSNYEIAAAAVHPLNYKASLQSYANKIPHKTLQEINSITETINDRLNTIKTNLKFDFTDSHMKPVTFNSDITIEIPEITFDDITVPVSGTATTHLSIEKEVTITIGCFPVSTDADGNFVYEERQFKDTIYIEQDVSTGYNTNATITGEQLSEQVGGVITAKLQEAFKDMNAKLSSQVNDLVNNQILAQVNDMLDNMADEINGKLDDVMAEINGLAKDADSYVDRINTYIVRINNILSKVYTRIDNIDYYLKPVMFIGGSSMKTLAASSNNATRIAASPAVLYPTSYFVETLNPAYKKFVKVTRAWDSKGNLSSTIKSKANSGANMNQVIDGNVRSVLLNVDSSCSGALLEVAYAALDYSGYQYVQKYYVRVK